MARLINIGLRLFALLWTLLITALIGNVIASNVNARTSATSAVNFTMFVAALSWVALLVGLAAAILSFLAIPILLLALDGLATLFTFIAAIVLAAKLGAPNCGNINRSDHGAGWIAFGSHDDEKRCREIQASTAFMWFLWACFMAIFFFTFKESRGSMSSIRSSTRPNMSQV